VSEWKPNKKQEVALLSTAFETLYGGARGGGKTDCGMAWLLYEIENPLYRALVIRKNGEDLKDWTDRARRMYSGTGAVFVGQPVQIVFPSGAKIYTGHLKDDSAYTKYQGHEYHRMLIEELTQIPSSDLYLKLISSCRSTVDIAPMVFCSANPGGVGHSWVKKRFIDVQRPFEYYEDKISGRKRLYIPATVDDNPVLMEKDPDYVKFLESLPEDLKQQWRYGNWDNVQFKGQIYGDEMTLVRSSGRLFEFSPDAYKQTDVAFDLGMSDAQSMVFAQGTDIIDYEEYTNKGWGYCAELLRKKSYNYRSFILPHDGTKRSAETLNSFEDFLRGEFPDVSIIILERTKSVASDLQKVRIAFSKYAFRASTTSLLIDALDQYRYDFDEKNGVFGSQPKHDWTSHPCDSFRYLVMAERDGGDGNYTASFQEMLNEPDY